MPRVIQAICKGHHELHAGNSISNFHIQAIAEMDFYKYLRIPHKTHARVGVLEDALLSEFLNECIRYSFTVLCIRNIVVDENRSTKRSAADTHYYVQI